MDPVNRKILQLVSDGVINADDGLRLLDIVSPDQAIVDEPFSVPGELQHSPAKPAWAAAWPFVFGLGIILASLGVAYSTMIFSGQIYWAWFFITAPAIIWGIIISVFGWLMFKSAWLRLQVRNQDVNIRLSLPLPLPWIAQLIRFARPWVPQLKSLVTDDILETIAASIREADFKVEVKEKHGEHVQVSYG